MLEVGDHVDVLTRAADLGMIELLFGRPES